MGEEHRYPTKPHIRMILRFCPVRIVVRCATSALRVRQGPPDARKRALRA